jgi:predicted TIM-barrel enzyme
MLRSVNNDAMPTSEVNMMLIKGVDTTSKADMAHVREAFELQTTVPVMVDNAVPTRKWSSLEATSVTTSTPTQI